MLINYKIIGIEQTCGGLYSPTLKSELIPVVEVASSALKRHFESPLIAEVAVHKLNNIIKQFNIAKNLIFGIIGNGYIGSALAKHLIKLGYIVIVPDVKANVDLGEKYNNRIKFVNGMEKVVLISDCIIGCTGTDCFKGLDILSLIEKNKVFISFSSEDKEFRSLLKLFPISPKN